MAIGGTAVLVQNRPFLGAMLVHVPLLDALRKAHPTDRLVLYSPFELASLLVGCGFADELVVYGDPGASLARALRRQRPDLLICLRRKSVRVDVAVATSGARRRVGLRYGLNDLVFRPAVPLDKTVYRAIAFLATLGPASNGGVPHDPGAWVRELAARANGTSGPPGAHCLFPCGSDDRKDWGIGNYLAYARRTLDADPGARFVFVLGPRERGLVEAIRSSDVAPRARCLVEASLPEIAAAVSVCPVAVTNDCAPGHLAQMSGVPVVCPFGNWDGLVSSRIGEWFYDRPRAVCLTTRAIAPASAIPVEAVVDASVAVRSPGAAPGGKTTWL